MSNFADLGLLPSLLSSLKEKRITKPTEIQIKAISQLLAGQSVVGVSETGSGKTLAYALPLLHLLKNLETEGSPVTQESSPRAVVIVPTRELGEQVSKVFKTLTHETRLRVRPALGGMAFDHARRNTNGAFEILLATPGRLVQMLNSRLLTLEDVRVIIFDEADQMLDQGFMPDSRKIFRAAPKGTQIGLFSATISEAVQELIDTVFTGVEVAKSSGSGKTVKSLVTKNLMVIDGKRWPVLEKLLAQKTEGGTILFCNTREQADRLSAELTEKNYQCVLYRGEMEIRERRRNMKRFREGEVSLMVATDVGSRGLDIEDVGRVVNYHMPNQMENYLHRAGRTARAGRGGFVFNFITERDARMAEKLGTKAPLPPPGTRGDREMREAVRDKRAGKVAPKKAFTKGRKVEESTGGTKRPTARVAEAKAKKDFEGAKPASRAFGAKPASRSGFGGAGRSTGKPSRSPRSGR